MNVFPLKLSRRALDKGGSSAEGYETNPIQAMNILVISISLLQSPTAVCVANQR